MIFVWELLSFHIFQIEFASFPYSQLSTVSYCPYYCITWTSGALVTQQFVSVESQRGELFLFWEILICKRKILTLGN